MPKFSSSTSALVAAIGPHQLHVVGQSAEGTPIVTVTYPVGSDTVLSIQPEGTPETRPAGSAGPYERALQLADRLVYAPRGVEGAVYLVPLVAELPN